MALTDYDKKNLSKKDQSKIQAATDKWNAANAKGDKAGMAAAAAEAAAVRNNAGYKNDSYGNYSGTYTPTSTSGSSGGGSSNKSGGNSQYTGYNYTIGSDYGKKVAQDMGIGQVFTATDGSVWTKENDGSITVRNNGQTYTNAYVPSDSDDWGTLGRQQVEAGVPYQYVQNTLNARVNKALSDDALSQYAYDDTYWMMWKYIQDNMQQTNQPDEWVDYELDNPRPTTPERDPRIDALLNEILNRDDFSYDAMNDPLYQQYAQMYRREGDRAMRNTLAEAAAGAGGMNTYAITAAQQANNYYNSQLNDKIPELYQLAYDMYLNDKASKVQDLGILQDMDATQFARYQDTMQNWKDDRNFAYGVYQDAVQQGNLRTNFDYNAMIDNRNFMNDNYLANREFNANQEQIAYNKSLAEKDEARYDQETAKDEVWEYISLGITPSADLIAKAGMTQSDVDNAVAAVKKQLGLTGGSGGGSGGGGGSTKKSGGSGGGGSGGDVGSTPNDMSDYTITNGHGDSWVRVPGLGRLSYSELENMVNNDTVIEEIDSKNKKISYRKA